MCYVILEKGNITLQKKSHNKEQKQIKQMFIIDASSPFSMHMHYEKIRQGKH